MVYNMYSNFEFIKEIDGNLYNLGLDIEKQMTVAPAAVLCEGITFIDNIICNIFENEDISYENRYFISNKNTNELDFLSENFKKSLSKVYEIKDKTRGKIQSAFKYIQNNEKRAQEMYNYLLDCSWYYCEYLFGVFDNSSPIDNNHCVICGKKTTDGSVFCSSCNEEKELLEKLNSIVLNFGHNNPFTKEEFRDFAPYDYRTFLLNLKTRGFLSYENNKCILNIENILKFRERINVFNEIENLFVNYFNNNISISEIRQSTPFIKGQEGKDLYINFYNIVFNDFKNKFLKEIASKKSIKEVFKLNILTHKEYNAFIRNEEPEILINKLVDEFQELKLEKNTSFYIRSNLFLDEGNYKKLKEIFENKSYDDRKELFYNSLAEGKREDEALIISGLTDNELNSALINDKEFRDDVNLIIDERKDIFSKAIETKGFNDAFIESKLSDSRINKLKNSKNHDPFYTEVNNILKKRYLELRESGKTHEEVLAICQIGESLVKNWLANPAFKADLCKIKIGLLIITFKETEDLKEALKISNISNKEFNKLLVDAYNGNEDYAELLELYREYELDNKIAELVDEFTNNKLNAALRKVGLDKKVFNLELESNEELANDFLEVKKVKYVYERLTHSHNKSLSRASLSKKEYNENKEELEEDLLNLRMFNIIDSIKENHNCAKAAKSINVNVEEPYNWYEEGKNGNEEYVAFANKFERIYLRPICRFVNEIKKEYNDNPGKVLNNLANSGQIGFDERHILKNIIAFKNNIEIDVGLET